VTGIADLFLALVGLQLQQMSCAMKRASANELDEAARVLDPEAVEGARSATARGCEELLRWADLFAERLDKIGDADLHKFARALALCQMGHLPTRPETCPFCLQYLPLQCMGCSYAQTHGRCEDQLSAFSRFIEDFTDLGKAIYQDTGPLSIQPAQARIVLQSSIFASSNAARGLLRDLPHASSRQLMDLKAAYLAGMIDLLPISPLGREVEEKRSKVRETLKSYW
jgi:hypothetical protein